MPHIRKCDSSDYPSLVELWEKSVRGSHDFLTEESITEIKEQLIPCYFPEVEIYVIADHESTVGFIGLSDDMIEMLFIDPGHQSKGYGSVLIEFAKNRGVSKVDVNEQNRSALRFYEAKGFSVIGRDPTDDFGRPYPILHMSL